MGAEEGLVRISTENGEKAIPQIMQYFESKGVGVESISLNRPTLDDVFMKYTKSSLQENGKLGETRSIRRSFARLGK
jgi:ABC-2 type transport system ATP-binding protein